MMNPPNSRDKLNRPSSVPVESGHPVLGAEEKEAARKEAKAAAKQPAQVTPGKKQQAERQPEKMPIPGLMGPPEGPGS
jgi:hypothetical protein